MSLPVITLISDSLSLWNAQSGTRLPAACAYTPGQRLRKEFEIDGLMQDVDASVAAVREHGREMSESERSGVRGRIQRAIVQMMHIFDCVIDSEMEERFGEVTREFVRAARAFDPSIDEESVYQASRNVLIMNSFQMHFGREIALTPSVLAYSLLYPYTDNYIDDAGVDAMKKSAANAWLGLRLAGEPVRIRSSHEATIDRLVQMIEGEFDRQIHPEVYESLLAIHAAQVRSLRQSAQLRPEPAELLDISIGKGGTSVLADACLVTGDLPRGDAAFVFRFGVLLQLIDDLQDLEEDHASVRWTPAGACVCRGPLDPFANRLFSFLGNVVEADTRGDARKDSRLTRLIEQSCRLLILEAIALHPDYFSDAYLNDVERQCPVSFDYLRSLRERSRRKYAEQRPWIRRASSFRKMHNIAVPA